VRVLSIAVLVLVLVLVLDALIIPAQGFRGTIEFHCHPYQHRHNSHLFGSQIERR
jgi:hypothetical protein